MRTTSLRAFRHPGTAAAALLAFLPMLLPVAAEAYVGPGAGLTALGTVIALILAVALAIIGFVWYPLKRLKRKRGARSDPAGTTPERK